MSGIAALTLYIVAVIRKQDDIAIIAVSLVEPFSGFFHIILIPQNIHGDTEPPFRFSSCDHLNEGTMKSITAIAVAIPILVLGLDF